jgi:hypothetical protein
MAGYCQQGQNASPMAEKAPCIKTVEITVIDSVSVEACKVMVTKSIAILPVRVKVKSDEIYDVVGMLSMDVL